VDDFRYVRSERGDCLSVYLLPFFLTNVSNQSAQLALNVQPPLFVFFFLSAMSILATGAWGSGRIRRQLRRAVYTWELIVSLCNGQTQGAGKHY